jgi:hypothetical protein
MKLLISVLLCASLASAAESEFPTVMAEENLERRSELALQEADRMITAAKKAYEENVMQDFKARVTDVEELVQLSYKSLQDTGKRARRNPKFFKRAEHNIRALMRRLDSLATEVALDDRDFVTAVHRRVSEIHDNVLHDVMTKK